MLMRQQLVYEGAGFDRVAENDDGALLRALCDSANESDLDVFTRVSVTSLRIGFNEPLRYPSAVSCMYVRKCGTCMHLRL